MAWVNLVRVFVIGGLALAVAADAATLLVLYAAAFVLGLLR
jgi:hypothetical protein